MRCSLPILFEDDHVLVVDKPAGLLSVPTGPGGDEDTVLGRVREYVHRLRPRDGFVERVHRLDRDTTGALAFALSREARAGAHPDLPRPPHRAPLPGHSWRLSASGGAGSGGRSRCGTPG